MTTAMISSALRLISNFVRPENWSKLLERISAYEHSYVDCSDAQLRRECQSLHYRARSGVAFGRLLPETFALVRAASARVSGMRHYDVQVLGGIALARGCIAEMETGEGKTLTATLPLVLYALAGKGAHLVTANDYLSRRDARLMQPLYEFLGFTTGVLQSSSTRAERQAAYGCDIVYGTAREIGFDFLRDRLALDAGDAGLPSMQRAFDFESRPPGTVQRRALFALVDEADAILIDDARTPLIIGAVDHYALETTSACHRWAAAHACRFQRDRDYKVEQRRRSVELTALGRELVRSLPEPATWAAVGLKDLYEHVERAVSVRLFFHQNEHYILQGGKVVIVDENTGRTADGRQWQQGLHQAIEAKEGVELTPATAQAARITVQDLFRRYQYLAGMTGTARSSRRELRTVYGLRVASIPTHRPAQRMRLAPRVFATRQEKWRAVVDEAREVCKLGRPVLIGTRTIELSEELSALLSGAGVEHCVLNARNPSLEAEIVAGAGRSGQVTVATNMAGRGTDIPLGAGVAALGGLHVICTELHDSARIDRQLIGRCARQGDPGSYRLFLSGDDEILRDARTKAGGRTESAGRWPALGIAMFRAAQRRVERRHVRQRLALLYQERESRRGQRQLGHDPYLESAG
jgi:preprotein translocase subunit SecA